MKVLGAMLVIAAASPMSAGAMSAAPGHRHPADQKPAGARPAPTPSLSRTVVERVRPVGPHGQLRSGYTVARRLAHASCEAGSEATGDAYRCFTGHFVVDPCWVTAQRDFVDCLADGWRHSVWRLHVTKGYDNAGYNTTHGRAAYPWGVALASGSRWEWLQGASGTVGNQRVDYSRGKNSHTVLIGGVDRSRPVWRIARARNTGHSQYERDGHVKIWRVWYGRPSLKG